MHSPPIAIDGSMGEGGGQVLRSSLALSLVTGTPFRMTKIRAGRRRPGLLRQHLTAVRAAVEVGRADVEGASLGSLELDFAPKTVTPGEYRFSVGTAGSTTLVLQTVLPALITAAGRSTLTVGGGTHNPNAPTFDFLDRTFLPVLGRMGPAVRAELVRHGFYPAGGGCLRVGIDPAERLRRIDLLERGALLRTSARAVVSRLPRHIGEREIETVRGKLSLGRKDVAVVEIDDPPGPGNVLTITVECEHITEVITAFGERGVPAERVASRAAREARRYISSGAPAGEHLADQLLLPMALAGGGSFRTVALSRHTTTNADVLRAFLDVDITTSRLAEDDWRVEVSGGSGLE